MYTHRRQLLAGVLEKPELALDIVNDEAECRCTCAHPRMCVNNVRECAAAHTKALVARTRAVAQTVTRKAAEKISARCGCAAQHSAANAMWQGCGHLCGGGQATGEDQADLRPCCHVGARCGDTVGERCMMKISSLFAPKSVEKARQAVGGADDALCRSTLRPAPWCVCWAAGPPVLEN